MTGALYYNSTVQAMKVYDGASWITATAAGTSAMSRYRYVATSGQTTFSGADANSLTLSYTSGNIVVARNGAVLDPSEYTASNGTSVVLGVAAGTGDVVDIVAFKSFTVADTYSIAQVDAFAVKLTGAQTVAGVKTFSSAPVLPSGAIPQAALAAGVAGNGPAFSATSSGATTITANTFTKITLDTEEFDTNSNFSSSTFTPTVAGYYQINGLVSFNPTGTASVLVLCTLYKNGSRFKDGSFGPVNSIQGGWTNVAAVVYLNGSTDYIELYGYVQGVASLTTQTRSFLSGALIRSA